jgi:hypothetical protein
MTRALVALLCALSLGCASFPPRTPAGDVNVPLLLEWASDGIEADCAFGINDAVCMEGRDTIALARAIHDDDPIALRAAVTASLADNVARWPVIAPYVQFVRDVL